MKEKKKSRRVLLALLIAGLSIASISLTTIFEAGKTWFPAEFHALGGQQTGVESQTQAQEQEKKETVLTPTGNDLIAERIEQEGPYEVEYDFEYPARVGYILEFSEVIDFSVINAFGRRVLKERDITAKTGKFDINEGETGTWKIVIYPKEGKLKGEFRLIEILRFE